MNKLTIIGNLTADPELRTIPSGINVCTFTVAVNRRFSSNKDERQTDFFRVTAWRQLGETCSRYLSKGRKVAVIGEVSARAFESKDGTLRASLEVTADEVEFLSPREPGVGGYAPQQGTPLGFGGQQQNQGWSPNRVSSVDSLSNTALVDAPDGFAEITDADLPF